MKEVKITTKYEGALLIEDSNFRKNYEERIGNNPVYIQVTYGDTKHLAICPRCNNPVAILGIYKQISTAPHARHVKGLSIPNVAEYNEDKLLHCPYYRKRANYIKEYVPEEEKPQRQELYRITKEHYDKVIYLLSKETGIYITYDMAEKLAKNYVNMQAYNYIDAIVYNIPWYLIYSFNGFPLHYMIVKKNTTLYRHLSHMGLKLKDSRMQGYVYVESNEEYLLAATNYRYVVSKNEYLNEWLDFSILRPDPTETDIGLFVPADRFSVKVDSNYFASLINYDKWKVNEKILDIAKRCMNA